MSAGERNKAVPISVDQSLLLRAGPTLDLPLAFESLFSRFERIRPNERHGPVASSVAAKGTEVVRSQTRFEIVRVTYVVTSIRAFQHVHVEVHPSTSSG